MESEVGTGACAKGCDKFAGNELSAWNKNYQFLSIYLVYLKVI